MDLDDQEWLYTLLMYKKLTVGEMKRLKEYYKNQVRTKKREIEIKEVEINFKQAEIRELLTSINRLEKEIGEIER